MGVSIKWFFSVVVSLCVSFSANAGLFKISINDLGGLTPSQSSVFDDAIAYWESYLIGVQSEFNHNIVVDASGVTPESTLWKFIAASLFKTPHLFL